LPQQLLMGIKGKQEDLAMEVGMPIMDFLQNGK
jgi:hypothetical protein